ncbi:MAG: CoA transferase [Candidatus Binatia bacterium]|nr:CoA transferase [Candidatus Binatia bacterium]
MRSVMKGVRVLEVAQYTFVPAAGAVLADWGADVIKVEHAETGDAQRGLRQLGSVEIDADRNPLMEHANRGKRSIGLDLSQPGARETLYRLAERSDVFLTNFLPSARTKLRIDLEDIRAANPEIIYVRGSAYGNAGPERDTGGYDMTAFWCRGGSAAGATPDGTDGIVGQPGPAYGDSIGGMTIAGGIAGALFARERTGETSVVDVSLLSTGMWAMGLAVDLTLSTGERWKAAPIRHHGSASNPLVGLYRTSDGRTLSLAMLQAHKYWPDFCRLAGRTELEMDPRFDSAEALFRNAGAASEIVAEIIGARPLSDWKRILAEGEGQWAPVQDTVELAADGQARENGYIVPVDADDGGTYELVASPVQFDEQPPAVERAPAFAEHTDEVLLELGLDWPEILELKAAGAVT